MDTTLIGSINLLPVLVAAVAAFILGSLWYSPTLFGKKWMQLEGIVKGDINKGHMLAIMVSSFIATFVVGLVLAFLIGGAGLLAGIQMGLLIGVGIVAAMKLTHYLYAGKCAPHFLIDAGYDLCVLVMMAAIIGSW